ncbi:sigma-70 family RNA polymerase sigma factor [Paludibacterium sp.]|uniref:sigma-70 family RNA polymerase sigma factor n=1 Tax=Paludibacterium sp. TaxID=1917523 RepID=UPI0025CCF293|nr:sigma-70 family RNA polymerase sigma factor [Paludibacterium sp.]MBV8647564.1 sigma-70 family RNA polymerase sigma factor [Paludibacterium sp.]
MNFTAEELEPHRPALLRYALFRLGNEAAAHDLVQDAFLAALEHPERFAGAAALRTWLTGILKHKIIDVQRKAGREITLSVPDEEDLSDLDTLFDQTGHWGADAPRRWEKPEACLEDQQFWQVYRECSQRMPPRSALVFTLRELHSLDVAEIGEQLDITPAHCSVLLYRARMSLRLCLEKNWFGATL